MALTPIDEIHAAQIQAGTLGRRAGHEFEDTIAARINQLPFPFSIASLSSSQHVIVGDPAILLMAYIAQRERTPNVTAAVALSTGALATSEAGKQWLDVNGARIARCKSDLVITITSTDGKKITVGVSTKQCSNPKPTNAQLYFTTARGFAALLRANGMHVSDLAVDSLRQFCGDAGFRPTDNPSLARNQKIDPRRFFWEEIDAAGRVEWENIFTTHQDQIGRLLLQKAYLNDPFAPDYLIHKTKSADSWSQTEVAIYSIAELIALSRKYRGFELRPYRVNKGRFRDPPDVTHLAPRFGIIQMQRGGQQQHPEQLQFNLEAGYFYKI
jgi:hypothetical protein